MLDRLKRHLFEWVRCTRHNVLHLKVFKVWYAGGGVWRVRDKQRGVEMVFPYYPYLDFHDIEGYLRLGEWRIETGMTVVDAGGCRGEFAVYAAKCVGPSGRVLMVEPDPSNIELAKKNFEMNGSPANITVVPAGVWKHPGKLRFAAGMGPTSTVIDVGDSSAPAKDGEIEIDVESFASLAARYGVERIDFIKMDVEGAELEAVEGAAALPPQHKPRYAIASYHEINGRKTADVLPDMFKKLGYESTNGNERHLTTWSWPAGTAS
jgi:FkbM family methyltransferase